MEIYAYVGLLVFCLGSVGVLYRHGENKRGLIYDHIDQYLVTKEVFEITTGGIKEDVKEIGKDVKTLLSRGGS